MIMALLAKTQEHYKSYDIEQIAKDMNLRKE